MVDLHVEMVTWEDPGRSGGRVHEDGGSPYTFRVPIDPQPPPAPCVPVYSGSSVPSDIL